jgi:hypothetical protein
VFRDFASGALTDDDEVAVRHLPASHAYRPTSDAMVNLRAGLAAARQKGALSARSQSALIALAKARFYPERSWVELIADGRAAGLPVSRLARLAPVDLKGRDAALLLRTLARTPLCPVRPTWRLAKTWFWRQLTTRA